MIPLAGRSNDLGGSTMTFRGQIWTIAFLSDLIMWVLMARVALALAA